MSVEKIIEKISLEAGHQAEAIIKTARDEAKKYLEKAEKNAEAEKTAEIVSRKREIDGEVARMLAQARMEGRQTTRSKRERLISDCFDLAREQITAIPETVEYPQILKYLIRDGIGKIGAENIIIWADSRDIPVLKTIISNEPAMKVRVSEEPIQVTGGVLLKTGSGARSVNNTFEARLERMRRDLIFEVAGILAGEREGVSE